MELRGAGGAEAPSFADIDDEPNMYEYLEWALAKISSPKFPVVTLEGKQYFINEVMKKKKEHPHVWSERVRGVFQCILEAYVLEGVPAETAAEMERLMVSLLGMLLLSPNTISVDARRSILP